MTSRKPDELDVGLGMLADYVYQETLDVAGYDILEEAESDWARQGWQLWDDPDESNEQKGYIVASAVIAAAGHDELHHDRRVLLEARLGSREVHVTIFLGEEGDRHEAYRLGMEHDRPYTREQLNALMANHVPAFRLAAGRVLDEIRHLQAYRAGRCGPQRREGPR